LYQLSIVNCAVTVISHFLICPNKLSIVHFVDSLCILFESAFSVLSVRSTVLGINSVHCSCLFVSEVHYM